VKIRHISLLDYKVAWKPSGTDSGASRGVLAGIGDHLRSLVLLRDHPDPRRLDLNASLRDPLERLWVRDFYLNTALKVVVLIDMSASMGFEGQVKRMDVACEVASNIALAAWRGGDAFGVYGANEDLRKDATLPPRINRGAWLWVNQHLRAARPLGKSAAGLLKVISLLPKRRSLVFVISDFRWPSGQLETLLRKIAHHDIVPIVLQDPTEMDALPKKGIAVLRDLESGERRFVWMRQGLVSQILHKRAQHLTAILDACRFIERTPFLVKGKFNPMDLTCYFLQGAKK
jgi:uncharacterized protein (DUF58 family)